MTEPGPDRCKSTMTHESMHGPTNHRDASSTSGCRWRNPPTPIAVPVAGEHLQRLPFRPGHDNPYSRTTNTLGHKHRFLGNPNVHQTLLAKPFADARPRKRQKIDASNLPTSGGSSSYAGGPVIPNNVPEPNIKVIQSSRATHKGSNPVQSDAGFIDLRASSDESVPRAPKSSSPDPLLLRLGASHAFETHPTEYSLSVSNKGKGRTQELPVLVVEGSEEEDIEEFTPPPPMGLPYDVKRSREIPKDIVRERKMFFESNLAPSPAAVRHLAEKGVKSVDLTTGTVASRMKRKNEGASVGRKSTGLSDPVGTSSSNFVNSPREAEKIQTLPLAALCLGHHLFQHTKSTFLKLVYEAVQQRITVIWGQSTSETVDFRLDRSVHSAMIVNDLDEALKENVVIQFITRQGNEWKEAERSYKGFEGGGSRGKEALTFLFSTTKDRGFSATSYQKFVTGIRTALGLSATEVISPSRGKAIWDYTHGKTAMFEQMESRKNKADHNRGVVNEPSTSARSITPGSSASIVTRTSCPESKPRSGDSGPSTSHRRSARQSAIRSSRTSPRPLSPVQLEPDEVILMYPPTGTGALSIMQSDLRRLQPEEYLNDTLIEFGLKLWLNDLREKDPTLADQVHIFSSFFYKKLNNRKNPEDGYKSVRKWTSKVDLFAKKYVIVPINENIHWYLAVICEPGYTLEPPLPPSHPSGARMTRRRKQKQEHTETNVESAVTSKPAHTEVSLELPSLTAYEGEPESGTSSVDTARAMTPSTVGDKELHDDAFTASSKPRFITATLESNSVTFTGVRHSSPNLAYPSSDGMEVDTDVPFIYASPNPTSGIEALGPSMSKPSSGIPVDRFYGAVPKPGDVRPVAAVGNEDSAEDQEQEAEVDSMLAVTQSSSGDLPLQTYIFTLDSLGARHPQAIKVLKQYLTWEAKDKRNFDEVRDAVGKQVPVPVQPNTWDCGIYLLHFVKVFTSAPSEILERILSTRGTISNAERKNMWQGHQVPQIRDNLVSRIIQLSEEWKVGKTVRDEEASKRRSGVVLEVVSSSEGEVDIVEDIPSIKATPDSKQRQHATRLRG